MYVHIAESIFIFFIIIDNLQKHFHREAEVVFDIALYRILKNGLYALKLKKSSSNR